MRPIRFELPRTTLLVDASIAALAAIGITILVGAEAYAMVVVPLVTGLITVLLVMAAGRAGYGPVHRAALVTDRPTGLAKEEVADQLLAREFAAAQRGHLLSIVLVRVEGVEDYRALHGEAATRRLLWSAGRVFARRRRGTDLAAHHGVRRGMFLAVLPGTDRDGAHVYASRIRQELMALPGLAPHGGVSIGVASFGSSMRSTADLIRAARSALEGEAEAPHPKRVVAPFSPRASFRPPAPALPRP